VGFLVQICGRGNVPELRPRALADAGVGQIDCGTRALNCYAQTGVHQAVTVGAKAEAGYHFAGWTGACTGTAPTCAVAASAAENLGANFTPKGKLRRVHLRVKRPRLSVRWVTSVGRGTLLLRGAVSARASLRLELRRPGGGPLLVRTRTVHAGAFRLRELLRNGRLLRGAKLFPGPFVIVLRGQSGTLHLPLQVRTLSLAGPKEGVVRSQHISASKTGPAVKRLPAGAAQAWAIFRLAAQPRTGPIVARWYQPNGQLLGTSEKNNRPTIKTGIGSATTIPSGTWRVDLTAGNRLLRRLNVRVG
jgi:uncharacterized repeat protein (TIGR02543 family)